MIEDLTDPLEQFRDQGFLVLDQSKLAVPSLNSFLPSLSASYDGLPIDAYLPAGATYRERRYGRLTLDPSSLTVEAAAHGPFLQTATSNPLAEAGGVAREFSPLDPNILDSSSLHDLILADFKLMGLEEILKHHEKLVHVDVHQFRILADKKTVGEPTPEGAHQDFKEEPAWVAIHLVGRDNIEGGESTIYDLSRQPIATKTLNLPMDTILVNDQEVMHGVSAITAVDSSRPATRDVLIINFRPEASLE